MAGMIPPFVMESVGGRVRKSQVIPDPVEEKSDNPQETRVMMSADSRTMRKTGSPKIVAIS